MFPADTLRQKPAAELLDLAWQLASDAGVTRLADITRLDRFDLPVWQAVRPRSRALSVHQGKGPTPEDAQLGALLEASESDAAERFVADGPLCSWNSLDVARRPSSLADYARRRDSPPDEDFLVQWTRASRPDGRETLVPFESVSLDFTLPIPSPFDRASAGLATGCSREEARRTALFELIERDAVSTFLELDMADRLAREIRSSSIAYEWFAQLSSDLETHRCDLRIFALPSVTRTPAFAATIRDHGKNALPYRAIVGHAAHPCAEVALFKAFSEALQSRLTFISGAREDCYPSLYDEPKAGVAFAFAAPPAAAVQPADFLDEDRNDHDVSALCERLADAGHGDIAFVSVSQSHDFFIERAFVPTLGSLSRDRAA